jgi:hypothetical protein
MARLMIFLLLCSAVLLAQDNGSANDSKSKNGTVTVTGCVDRQRGDYVLIQQNPAITYELQGTDKAKLRNYIGQRVQVTGSKFPSMETSSDAIAGGSPAPVTIRVSSIKTIAKECNERSVPSH